MNVICYRCGGGENPENTLMAIEHCQNINADWPVEMDLQLTKDGEIILFHDSNTQRITGQNYNIADLTLNEIKSLNAGYNFKSEEAFPFRNHPIEIPTLREVILKFPTLRLVLDVHTEDLSVISKIVDLIESSNLNHPVVVVSSYDEVIQEFRRQKPGWKYSAATKEAKKLIYSSFLFLDWLFPLRSEYLMIPQTFGKVKVLTSRVISHVKRRNRAIWAWIHEGERVRTVETLAQAESLYAIGVEAVFTDYPKKLSEELRS